MYQKESNQKKMKKEKAVVIFAAVAMASTILAGCGSTTSEKATEPSQVTTDSVVADSSASGSAASSTEAADTSKNLSSAELLRGGRNAAEDENYVYLCSNSVLNRYEKKNLSNYTSLYHSEDAAAKPIISFYVHNGNVYVLQNTSNDTSSSCNLVLITADGKSSILKTFDDITFSQVRIDDSVLYLSGYYDAFKMQAFDLNSDGTLGAEKQDLAAAASRLPANYQCLSGIDTYSTSYYDPAYCMAVYGKVYLINPDNKLVEIDNLLDKQAFSAPKVIASLPSSSIYGMTSKYIIFGESNYGTATTAASNTYSVLNLADGTTKEFTSNNDTDFLDYDENGIYLGNITTTTGSDQASVSTYTVTNYCFDGSSQKVFSFEREPSSDLTYNTFGSCGCAFLSGGIYYVRSSDYANCGFARSYADASTETALGGDPFFDSGLDKAGIKLVNTSYTKYADDSTDGKQICSVNLTIPQFTGDTAADKKINEMFTSQAKKGADDIVSSAASDYKDYLSYSSSVSASEDTTATGTGDTMGDSYDYSGFPYQYSYLFTGVTYSDDKYISLKISKYVFTGGAHGNSENDYYLLNKTTGDTVKLSDLISTSNKDFKALVIKYLQQKIDAAPEGFFESDATAALSYSDYSSLDKYNFYLTKDGIGIEFGNYEVAPYAAGPQDIVIPYSEVTMKK